MPNCQWCGVEKSTESWKRAHEYGCKKNPEVIRNKEKSN